MWIVFVTEDEIVLLSDYGSDVNEFINMWTDKQTSSEPVLLGPSSIENGTKTPLLKTQISEVNLILIYYNARSRWTKYQHSATNWQMIVCWGNVTSIKPCKSIM